MTRAVFFDVLGTLLDLDRPVQRFAELLDIDEQAAGRAFQVEMAYYKEHSHEARDRDSLAELRERCATLLSGELARTVTVEQMMSAIRFQPYPDSAPTLEALRSRDLALVAVSNWDCSLPDVLEQAGLLSFFEAVVDSATAGAPKPDPSVFALALEAAGCAPAEALHVGDTFEEDVLGAHAAGVPVLHLDREGGGDIASLAEVPERV